ncbi:hypothetical protein PG984_005871 [Apiospora sp. TS-2023a]
MPLLTEEDDDVARFVLVKLSTTDELALETLLAPTVELVLTTGAEVDVVSGGELVVAVSRETVSLVIELLNILWPVLEERDAATVVLELPFIVVSTVTVSLMAVSFVFSSLVFVSLVVGTPIVVWPIVGSLVSSVVAGSVVAGSVVAGSLPVELVAGSLSIEDNVVIVVMGSSVDVASEPDTADGSELPVSRLDVISFDVVLLSVATSPLLFVVTGLSVFEKLVVSAAPSEELVKSTAPGSVVEAIPEAVYVRSEVVPGVVAVSDSSGSTVKDASASVDRVVEVSKSEVLATSDDVVAAPVVCGVDPGVTLLDSSMRLVEASSDGPASKELEVVSVVSVVVFGAVEGMLPISELELDKVETVSPTGLVSSTLELESGGITPEVSEPIADAVVGFKSELGCINVSKLPVPPNDVVEDSEGDVIVSEGVTVAPAAVESDLSVPAVTSVSLSVLVDAVAVSVLVSASAVDMELDSDPVLPAGFEAKDGVSVGCIIDDPVIAVGDVVTGPDTPSSEPTLAKVAGLLSVDNSRDVSVLVNVPASCKELDVVIPAALSPELGSSMGVAVSLVEEAAVVDTMSLGSRVPDTGLPVVPSVTGGSDADPAKVVIAEIPGLSVPADVLLTGPISDPDMPSIEVDVGISPSDEELVEATSVSVRTAGRLDVPTVPDKPFVLESTGDPSAVNWPFESLSVAAEAPESVGLGNGAD